MGSIEITVTGGSGNYTYQWDNGATTASLTGLPAGEKTVTITDANSCGSPTLLKTYEITPPAAIVVNIGSITTACNGNNGTAVLSASGGNGGYNFSSSPGGSVSGTSFSAAAGSYTITATDSKGCTGTALISISDCPITGGLSACANPQGFYGKEDNSSCNNNGGSISSKQTILNAINAVGGSYTFGLAANNRTFTLTLADINTGGANAPIFKMLPGGGNNMQRFGQGGATYSSPSTWGRVPLAANGKITNPLFAQTITMFFNMSYHYPYYYYILMYFVETLN